MGLEILMIDIKRLHELEKEVQSTHDQIIRQVWLVHHIIGKDTKSDRNVLINIDRAKWNSFTNQRLEDIQTF